MSKDTFEQAAERLFASTTHQVLWANIENPNQEFFSSENIGMLSLGKEQKLTRFVRPEGVLEEKTVKNLNATEAVALISKAESAGELAAFEADERKSVKAAFELKMDELVKAGSVVDATPVTASTAEKADMNIEN